MKLSDTRIPTFLKNSCNVRPNQNAIHRHENRETTCTTNMHREVEVSLHHPRDSIFKGGGGGIVL